MDQSTIEFIIIFVSILALLLLLILYNSSKKKREEKGYGESSYRSAYGGGAGSGPSGGYSSGGGSGSSGGHPPGGGFVTGGGRRDGGPEKSDRDSLRKADSLEKTSYVWSTGEEKYAGKASSDPEGKGLRKGRFSSASTKKDKVDNVEKVLDTDIEKIYTFHYSKRLRICPYCGSENDVSNPVCESCKESLR